MNNKLLGSDCSKCSCSRPNLSWKVAKGYQGQWFEDKRLKTISSEFLYCLTCIECYESALGLRRFYLHLECYGRYPLYLSQIGPPTAMKRQSNIEQEPASK